MKIIDIAIKDLMRSLRNATALAFMFGIPLLMTGMFYFMFGNIADQGEFSLPRTRVMIANQDEGGPNLGLRGKNVPGDLEADTLGELVVKVLQSDELAGLVEVTFAPDAAAARQAVDSQQVQVAIIIPPDFSHQFADTYGQAEIEFYQDPTLTIGPEIIKAVMSQFMDSLAGINIAVDIAIEQAEAGANPVLISRVIQEYMDTAMLQDDDLSASMLDVRLPVPEGADLAEEDVNDNPLVNIIGPIMGGLMIFFAFYTGTSAAESILREEEERTLPRLFTTPTPQATILSGKLLAVFLTLLVQIATLLFVSRLLFGIQWGDWRAVALTAVGIICIASSFGIFINSLLKDTKQGGVIFGGVLTLTGMVGMIRTFSVGSSEGSPIETVSLFVPQGWAIRGLLQSMNGDPISDVLVTMLVMLGVSLVVFLIGVWRFNRRYA